MPLKIQRRKFFNGIGVTLALPWLESMSPRSLHAAASVTPPRRFVTFYQPNGVKPKAWDVEGTGPQFPIVADPQTLPAFRDDFPLVLIRKGQGQLRSGQHFACPKGTPLANLHLTLAQQFDVATECFNGASTGTINGIFH